MAGATVPGARGVEVGTPLEVDPSLAHRVQEACVEEGEGSWGCSLEGGRLGRGGEGEKGAGRR